ncbi:MAG: DUF2080 family transposase-associated protein [Thermoplasmata archaeon]
MKKVKMNPTTKLTIEGIAGFIERKVTPFGTGAKVDCPKEHLGKRVILVVLKNEKDGGKNQRKQEAKERERAAQEGN